MNAVLKLFSFLETTKKYTTVGQQIRAIFKRYTDKIEPMSIDEAYLDVTENKLGIKSAVKNCSFNSAGYLE